MVAPVMALELGSVTPMVVFTGIAPAGLVTDGMVPAGMMTSTSIIATAGRLLCSVMTMVAATTAAVVMSPIPVWHPVVVAPIALVLVTVAEPIVTSTGRGCPSSNGSAGTGNPGSGIDLVADLIRDNTAIEVYGSKIEADKVFSRITVDLLDASDNKLRKKEA